MVVGGRLENIQEAVVVVIGDAHVGARYDFVHVQSRFRVTVGGRDGLGAEPGAASIEQQDIGPVLYRRAARDIEIHVAVIVEITGHDTPGQQGFPKARDSQLPPLLCAPVNHVGWKPGAGLAARLGGCQGYTLGRRGKEKLQGAGGGLELMHLYFPGIPVGGPEDADTVGDIGRLRGVAAVVRIEDREIP